MRSAIIFLALSKPSTLEVVGEVSTITSARNAERGTRLTASREESERDDTYSQVI